jgi:hypothetical protein
MTPLVGLTGDQLVAQVRASHWPFQSLAKTALHKEILCVELGGSLEPPIVITAGSHATEWAGPLAALRLLKELKTQHKVYLIPCRDPLGLEGFNSCLRQSSGLAEALETVQNLPAVLGPRGHVVYDEGGVTITTLGSIGAVVVDESRTRQFVVEQHLLPEMVPTRPDLIEALGGKYLLFAEEWPKGRYGWHGGPLDHPAEVLFVSHNGAVGNLNRFFNRDDAPVEVSSVRDLLNRVKPGLTLDLHEGFGEKFYLIVPLSDDPFQDRIARAMAGAVRDHGFALSSFDELAPDWGPKLAPAFHDLGDGIFSGEHMTSAISLGSYGRQFGPTVTTEAGMDASIEQRVDLIVWSVLAAVDAYEAHYR